MRDPKTMKSDVIAFFEMMFTGRRRRDAVERGLGAGGIPPNPDVASGKERFIKFRALGGGMARQ